MYIDQDQLSSSLVFKSESTREMFNRITSAPSENAVRCQQIRFQVQPVAEISTALLTASSPQLFTNLSKASREKRVNTVQTQEPVIATAT